MTQFHKRGLFDLIKDAVFFYWSNHTTRCDYDCSEYKKINGYVKNETWYLTKLVEEGSVRPLMYEEDFDNITEDDYKHLGVDYIAVYKCVNMCDTYNYSNKFEITSFRRYDGQYFPTARSYKSLFLIMNKNYFTI